MKHVLCFGDSNTWGYIPGTDAQRLAYPQRLCGVLSRELGDGFRFIEEGLSGRTTVFDDPMRDGRNGKRHLPMLLETHKPLDLIVCMLGTNDLKSHLNLRPVDIALGAQTLCEMILLSDAGPGGAPPKILLVSPAHVSGERGLAPKFDGAIARSQQLGKAYAAVARRLGLHFFDAAETAVCPVPDGVHLGEAGTESLGRALAQHERTILN